jgi:protein tyrosine/serine phosphatase
MKRGSLLRLASLLTLAVFLSAALAQNQQKYPELPNFHQVNANLYRGGQPKPEGFEKLSRLGIKTILNLRDDDDREANEERLARAAGFNYFNIPFPRQGRPTEAEIQSALAIIRSSDKQPVFVHCKYGADRTGVLIGAYRILYEGWTGDQAKSEAERYGMKFWQLGKKNYLSELYERKHQASATVNR